MATSRHQHEPPTQAPLQPTTSNSTSLPASSLRSQTSQHSLRSNASAASSRSRQPNSLFAPALSRRPTSRANPRVEDGVLADSESDQEQSTTQHRQRQLRRVRHGSPEAKHSKYKAKQEDEPDFVNRQSDGSYLLKVAGVDGPMAVPPMSPVRTELETELAEIDARNASIARQYISTGASLERRGSKKQEEHEEYEQLRMPLMLRLRDLVMQQLEDEKWRYEPMDRF